MKQLRKSNDPIKRVLLWNRLEIGVSHEPGDKRHGHVLTAGYGHIRGSYGDPDPVSGEVGDGMAIDVWIGADLGSPKVFRVKQIRPETGEFDEWKYVIGCWSQEEAKQLYLACMPKRFFAGVESVDPAVFIDILPRLKAWDSKGSSRDCRHRLSNIP